VKEAPEGDQPWGLASAILEMTREATGPDTWGGGEMLSFIDPSAPPDGRIAAWWRRYERLASTPNAAATMLSAVAQVDVRPFLEFVQAPTLILHRSGSKLLMPGAARHFAERIEGAHYRELAGDALTPYLGDQDSVLVEVEEFVTGTRPPARADRFLATVVFSDIVGSTEHAERLGDARWRDTLAGHNAVVEQLAARQGGRVVDTAGDGALAVFDGPTRAVNYASALVGAVHQLGLQVRAGVHAGEVERRDGDGLAGMAVHIGARVSGRAGADEVLVTGTVRDLTVGSGLVFVERGDHELKGVPGRWPLYALAQGSQGL
jgi:class 3 adenylate cyclase